MYQPFGVYLFRVDSRNGRSFIFIDPVDGGHGARPSSDGPTLIFLGDGDTPNTPVEVIETRYPIRCERHAYLPGVEGPGTHRGGLGLVRDFRVLEPGISMQCSIEPTHDTLARGLDGGGDGELLTVEQARDRYGVVVERAGAAWSVDEQATRRRRSGAGE